MRLAMISCFFLTSTLIIFSVEVIAHRKLLFAAVVYRHGSRTPIEPYPNDPYGNQSFWPEKFGQLTNLGKMQHYLFGHSLQLRFKDLLSPFYDPDEVYVLSTETDRTMMSAEVNSAGLFRPRGKDIWFPKLMWQPIPIHIVSKYDAVLAMGNECPAYDREMERYMQSEEYQQYLKKYRDLMRYLSVFTGMNITDFTHLNYVYSVLKIENEANLRIPGWANAVLDNMKEPAGYSFYKMSATPKLAKLKGGPLLKEIRNNMLKRIVDSSARKLYLYSGHDNTVAALLGALRMMDNHCPPFTAAVFIELYNDDKLSKYLTPAVRISYRNATNVKSPTILRVPGCGDRDECPLHLFLNLYANVTDVDFSEDCFNLEGKKISDQKYYGNLIVFVVVVSLLTWRLCFCGRDDNGHLENFDN